jgi:hypothetical protein
MYWASCTEPLRRLGGAAYVRSGSKSDISVVPTYVCFTSESGHRACTANAARPGRRDRRSRYVNRLPAPENKGPRACLLTRPTIRANIPHFIRDALRARRTDDRDLRHEQRSCCAQQKIGARPSRAASHRLGLNVASAQQTTNNRQ